MKKTKFTVGIFFAIAILLSANTILADDNNTFDPNYIISDAEMLDTTSMPVADIQTFLESKNSFLATYKTKNVFNETKSAAEIIYDAANNNYDCDEANLNDRYDQAEVMYKCEKTTTVNPKLLLVLLQKEMSLVEDANPTERQLDFAVGYGCPDGRGCSSAWRGFGKQVNSAALQFVDYLKSPNYYTYKAGNTYTVTNSLSDLFSETSVITPFNQATAALYNYTPHVYYGNYNFHNLWQRYFSINYPDGSLLQAEGEVGVWLIQKGQKRPFLTKTALTSRFDINKIIIVNKSDLDKYVKGPPVKFPNYSLVRSPEGNIYLLVDEKRRGFNSSEAFRKIGFNPEEVMDASWEDINSYLEGKPITATSTYPTGALLQDKSTGGVYWVNEGEKAPVLDRIFLNTKFKNKKIIQVSSDELMDYTKVDPILFDDGELVKSSASSAVYLISNGKKRPFISGKAFEDLGYKWENIITVSPQILYYYELGEAIAEQ